MSSTWTTTAVALAKRFARRTPLARLRYRRRFRGQFGSHHAALNAVRLGALRGYDHHEVVDINCDDMCQVKPWDYPVLFWLERLLPDGGAVLDAGGHVGTKYRAFRDHLRLDARFEWTVYDMPSMVRAGRELALRDALPRLHFIDDLADAPPAHVLLASGLLQYLDIPFSTLVSRLPTPPRHLLLNKVATREGDSIVMLENFGQAEVPYHVHNHGRTLQTLESLGYDVVDAWTIPSLSMAITAQANSGEITSRGFYARLR